MAQVSVTYESLRAALEEQACAAGSALPVAAQHAMLRAASAMAGDLPAQLLPDLAAAQRRWSGPAPDQPSLEPARVRSWQHLDTEGAGSAMPEARSHLAVRALICVLWDVAPDGPDLEETLEWFAVLAQQYGGLEHTLGVAA